MIVVGIDPGLTGGIAVLDTDWSDAQPRYCIAMPIIAAYTGGRTAHLIDAVALYDFFASMEDAVFFVEKVHSMPKQGVASAFKFGRGLGVIEGVIAATKFPLHFVSPQRWQKVMHADIEGTDPKARSVIAAKRLFPHAILTVGERSTKPHLGLTESLLIAEFGRRQLLKQV